MTASCPAAYTEPEHTIPAAPLAVLRLAVARGETERACRLLGAAGSQRAATGGRTALAPPQEFERDVATVRSSLAPEAIAAAWAAGQALTLAQAIEYALQENEA